MGKKIASAATNHRGHLVSFIHMLTSSYVGYKKAAQTEPTKPDPELHWYAYRHPTIATICSSGYVNPLPLAQVTNFARWGVLMIVHTASTLQHILRCLAYMRSVMPPDLGIHP